MKIRNILTFLLIAATTLTGASSTFAFGPGSRVEKVVAIYPGDKDCHPWTSNETYRCETANKKLNFIHGQVYNWSRNTEFARLVPGYNPGTGSAVTIDKNKAYWYVDASKNVWQGGRYYGRAVNVKNHGQWIDVSLWGGHVVLYKPNSNKISSRFPASVSIPELKSIGLSLVRDELCPENTIFTDYTCTYDLDIVFGFETCPLNSAREFYNCTNIADERPTVIKELHNAEPVHGHAAEVCPEDTSTELYDCKYINRIFDDLREKKVVALYYGQSDNRCPTNTLSTQYICKYSYHTFSFLHGDTADWVNDDMTTKSSVELDANVGKLSYANLNQYWRVLPATHRNTIPVPDEVYDIYQLNTIRFISNMVVDHGTWVEVTYNENSIVIYKDEAFWPTGSTDPKISGVSDRKQIPLALFYGTYNKQRSICPEDTDSIDYICVYKGRDNKTHGLTLGNISLSGNKYRYSFPEQYHLPSIEGHAGGIVVDHGKWVESIGGEILYKDEKYWPYEETEEDNLQILALINGETCPEEYVCKYSSSAFSEYHGKIANHIVQTADRTILALGYSDGLTEEWKISGPNNAEDNFRNPYFSGVGHDSSKPLTFGVDGMVQTNRSRWIEFNTPDGDEIIIFKDKKYWPKEVSSINNIVVVGGATGVNHSIIESTKRKIVLPLFYEDDNNSKDICPENTNSIDYICKYSDRKFSYAHGSAPIYRLSSKSCSISSAPPYAPICRGGMMINTLFKGAPNSVGYVFPTNTNSIHLILFDTTPVYRSFLSNVIRISIGYLPEEVPHVNPGYYDAINIDLRIIDYGSWFEIIIPENQFDGVESKESNLVITKPTKFYSIHD